MKQFDFRLLVQAEGIHTIYANTQEEAEAWIMRMSNIDDFLVTNITIKNVKVKDEKETEGK